MTTRQERLDDLDRAIQGVVSGSGRISDLIDSLDCAYFDLQPGDLTAQSDPTEKSHAWVINCHYLKSFDNHIIEQTVTGGSKSEAIAVMDRKREDHMAFKFDDIVMRYEEYIRTYEWRLAQVTCS